MSDFVLPTGAKPLSGPFNIESILRAAREQAEAKLAQVSVPAEEPVEAEAAESVDIVKYKNRKYYDKRASKYVNIGAVLDELIATGKAPTVMTFDGIDITNESLMTAISSRLAVNAGLGDIIELVEDYKDLLAE